MNRLPPILAAEDEETDAFFLHRAFQKAAIPNPLVITPDGQETVEWLERCHAEPEGIPCLLLLDLNMPRLSGFEVLEWLAARAQFRHMPAVVLSSSSYREDIERAMALGACEYCIKPHRAQELVELIGRLYTKYMQAPVGIEAASWSSQTVSNG